MMKSLISKWIIIFILFISKSVFSFEINAYEKKIKTNYNVTLVTEKISRDSLEKNLRDFVNSGRPNRYVGSIGHKKSLEFLEEKLRSFKSAQARFEKDEFIPIKSENGVNLIWEKKGLIKPDEVIIIGANLDTILNDSKVKQNDKNAQMPGADNNASGVAALLSLIEILDKLDLPKTVRILFFDFEDFGSYGSKHYAEVLKSKNKSELRNIFGFINISMIGHDSKREDKEKKFNNMKAYIRKTSEAGHDDDKKLARLLLENGKRLYTNIDFALEENSLIEGPQTSFWDIGIPAICFSQNRESDFNPRYHTSNDFVETLNMSTYLNAFRFITGSIIAWNYDIVK